MPLIHHELTEQIIRIYYDVYTELGHGFLEKVCQAAMVIALRAAGLSVLEHESFPVTFRGHLRASKLEVALIMNFGPKREYWRRILTNDRKTSHRSV
jgi:hypothetical protein